MKTRDIASQYHIDQNEFEKYLQKVNAPIKYSFTGVISLESNVEDYVRDFKEYVAKKEREWKAARQREAEEAERRRRAEEEKQRALASMLITSGFNFDGYKITKYSGYISGDDAISIDRGTAGFFSSATDVGSSLTASLVKIRRRAIQELKEAAYDLGCNAVIGVDFDYITLEPETANSNGGTTYLPYVFCVTANGNAVIIEKIEE